MEVEATPDDKDFDFAVFMTKSDMMDFINYLQTGFLVESLSAPFPGSHIGKELMRGIGKLHKEFE